MKTGTVKSWDYIKWGNQKRSHKNPAICSVHTEGLSVLSTNRWPHTRRTKTREEINKRTTSCRFLNNRYLRASSVGRKGHPNSRRRNGCVSSRIVGIDHDDFIASRFGWRNIGSLDRRGTGELVSYAYIYSWNTEYYTSSARANAEASMRNVLFVLSDESCGTALSCLVDKSGDSSLV